MAVEPIHPIMQKLRDSGLVEAVGFPVAVQAPELIYECINHYNPDTQLIIFPDSTVLISINYQIVVNYFRVLERDEFSNLTVSGAVSEFSAKKMVWRKEIMHSWFQKLQGAKRKVPKALFKADLKPKIMDILVLIHKMKGEVEALNFMEFYFFPV